MTGGVTNPFRIGDPVMDAAQGRAMVVLDAPDQTVDEWSENNNYDLLDNYANARFDPSPTEAVVECVYVSDVRSKPSKSYTFPASRCVLIEAHRADTGERLADRVVEQLATDLFGAAIDSDTGPTVADVSGLLFQAGVGDDIRERAEEVAKAARESAPEAADE